MKRILVAGGAGFIGSHLCRRLLEEGNDIICVDNLVTGRRENIKDLIPNSRFEFTRHDVIEPLLVEVDQVYHLASPASPIHYQSNGIKTLKTNFLGTYNLLGIAKRVGARFLLASTSEVYGDPDVHPQPETYWGNCNPIGERSMYDEGKRVAEALTMQYYRQNDVEVRIVRIFNTYGPLMCPDDGRVVSNFIVQALRGEPLTVFGDGSQTRSFCYVSDLVDGLIRMMNSGLTGPVNLGNPCEKTVLEIAQQVLEMIGGESKIEYRELPSDDPRRRKPDISLARERLGWEPKIGLEEGLAATIEYFRKRIAKQNAA
ncbi:MAG TPA: UDP-glucuronic acid decarboxylase family protein [Blastocatellia bacterium]|jgi:UDP-glucuronate decarboxylase|nr:UDP-glucuronic acid decarboxylase family protein [Blastocatellia bacterium]